MLSRRGLHEKRALHCAQSTTQPFLRRGAIILLLLDSGGGKDAVVGVGECPDGGIGSGSSGNGTKLIAYRGELGHSSF